MIAAIDMADLKIQRLPDVQQVEKEANAWIVAFEAGDPSPATFAEFEAWRKQSALHEDVYERLSLFWRETDVMERLGDYAESDAAAAGMRHDRFQHGVVIARRVAFGGLAASLVAVICVNTYDRTFGVNRSFSGEYQTAIGEQETIDLPDGSQIVLNTSSALQVAYTKGARSIHLKRGEAYFDVASNKQRPFSVETEKGGVTAIGTAFTVSLRAEGLNVVVAEGKISLDVSSVSDALSDFGLSSGDGTPRTLEVEAGHSATIDRGVEAISTITPDVLDKQLDWRDGVLTFEGETLENVIAEISRYSDLVIEIRDADLRNEKIVAYYKIGSVDGVFEALRLMEHVEVERVSNRHVRLSRIQSVD